MCAYGDGLVIAFTGTNRRLNLLGVGPGGPGTSVRLDANSSFGPAVCDDEGELTLGWTGTDGRINVTRVPWG